MNLNLIDAPYFSDFIYENLPEPLKRACSIYESRRERDIYLLSQLTTLSAVTPNMKGAYRKHVYFPNLFSFIIGPPASGKSVIQNSRIAIRSIEKKLLAYIVPKNTKFANSIFIPGNSSDSDFVDKLFSNDGIGIFFETEADTISNTLKQDWGGYDDKWRKGWNHEEISKGRKSEKQEIVISKPKFSICITGTPDQFHSIIPSVKNGLMSRIFFYVFDVDDEFENPFSDSNFTSFESFYEEIAADILKIYENSIDTQISFNLSNQNQIDLTAFCDDWYKWAKIECPELRSIIKRYGVGIFRISQILSYIRLSGLGKINSEIECLEVDFTIAKEMVNTLLEHVLFVFDNFGSISNKSKNVELLNLLKLLPVEKILSKNEILEIWGDRFCKRTVGNRIKALIDAGSLHRIMNDKYAVVGKN